ncbi:MAG: amidase family protein, partial [Patescibacteria group bacterium]
MSVINIAKLTIGEAGELLHSGAISSRELLEMHRAEIKKSNNSLNAYLEIFEDAYEAAEDSDKRLKQGSEPRMLEGIPVAVKDNILIAGKISSAAS